MSRPRFFDEWTVPPGAQGWRGYHSADHGILVGFFSTFRISQGNIPVLRSAMPRIAIDYQGIAQFCKAHHIHKLALFGSVLRDDFGPDSDVDVLVEFEPEREPGLFGMVRMEREISPLFGGRKVDLRTPGDLGRHMRERVVASAEEIFAA